MNNGERDELIIKLKLIELRDKKTSINIGNGLTAIESVGFNNVEYKRFPMGINLNDIIYKGDNAISLFVETLGITKAPARSKSDVTINGIGISLKSMSSAPPAIVNHTPRTGFEIACNHSTANINELDNIILKYWELRKKGQIKEDVRNDNLLSPFKDQKNALSPFINYFLFDGSGSGLSRHQASLILDYYDPIAPNKWKTYNRNDAVDLFWDRLVFSVRSKGMPESYPSIDATKFDSIKIWTEYFQKKYRGSLHIRTKD